MIIKYKEKINKGLNNIENRKYLITYLIGLFTICFFIFDLGGLLNKAFTSLANLFSNVDGEIKQVIIQEDGYDSGVEGSIKISASADWSESGYATLLYEVDTIMNVNTNPRDVIIILDTSKSDGGMNLDDVKKDIRSMASLLLLNNNNSISLITFNGTAEILSSFTNEKDEIMIAIDAIESELESNYYNGLLKLSELLENYEVSHERELIVLFLTDGCTTKGKTNQISQYKIIKSKYPDITIYGIDYEVSDRIISDLELISDIQVNAHDYKNGLLEPALSPIYYESFELTEFISDNFYIENIDDIVCSVGSVNLIEENGKQKIIWSNDAGEYRTGRQESLEVKIKLKDELIDKENLYPIVEKTTVNYKLNGENTQFESNDTPILKNGYKIIYDIIMKNAIMNITFSKNKKLKILKKK